MGHIALYRAWRPTTFTEVVGQEHITKTLVNALRENRFSHAYLFSGPRGTGKTSAAKIFAKAVNCEQGPAAEPCNTCHACLKIGEGAVMDVVEIDAASNRGVEEIRDIREQVKYAPTEVRHKVYIIDEVHMLTTEAFNALLKTLEEPPQHVVFILATTEPHRLPSTIISRCQRFDFRRVELQSQIQRLEHICEQEAIEIEPEAMRTIARLSDGGMRDALSLLDQIVSYTDGEITYNDVIEVTGGIASDQFASLAAIVRDGDVGQALVWVDEMLAAGKAADKCVEDLIQFYRDLLVIKVAPTAADLADSLLALDKFRAVADQYEQDQLFQIIDVLTSYHSEMRYAGQPQTLFEVALMKVCTLDSTRVAEEVQSSAQAPLQESIGQATSPQVTGELTRDVQTLLQRVTQLEEQLSRLSTTTSKGVEGQRGATSHKQQTVTRRPSASMRLSKTLLNRLQQEQSEGAFKEVSLKWNEVLGQVKNQKITVHAWLVNGEPVMAGESFVLVAFKNTIHRETTEKPANKQLIEQVLQEKFQRELRLETIMNKEWEQLKQDPSTQDSEKESEPFMLEPEEVPEQASEGKASKTSDQSSDQTSEDSPKKYEQDWINEAINWFGEELVTIQKDNKGDASR